MECDYDVVIVGGGIAGLATAVALKNCIGGGGGGGTATCRIVEQARRLEPVGAAIGLFPNGLAALQAISPAVHQRVLDSCIGAMEPHYRYPSRAAATSTRSRSATSHVDQVSVRRVRAGRLRCLAHYVLQSRVKAVYCAY